MSHPLGVDGVSELAVLERSGLIESRHLGAAVVVGPGGEILRTVGDGSAIVYPRSALKFLQAITVLRAGVDLDGEHLVVASSSHGGTPAHIRVVQEILSAAGLDETALQCPAGWPLHEPARDAMIASRGVPSRLRMTCSGKHAAFLRACVHNGWPIESYLAEAHPLQQLIRTTVSEYAGERIEHSGTDGCGAPVHALTLAGLALATGRVSSSADEESARLTRAILAHPWALDGPGRSDTLVIEKLGILAKGGAEGIIVMGTSDGHAVALKILDGSMRVATLVALELLAAAGAIDREHAGQVTVETTQKVLGGSQPAGEIRATV